MTKGLEGTEEYHTGSGLTDRGRGGRGQSAPPPPTSDWEISADLPGKKGKRGENWEENKENCKREGEKLKMEGGKLQNEERTFFFFFCFSLFKTTQICFGSTKLEIFYREKALHTRKKIRKNDFAPSEKFSCYAPAYRIHWEISMTQRKSCTLKAQLSVFGTGEISLLTMKTK